MLNRIMLMGRLTRDPELRHTRTGTAVAENVYFGDSKHDGEQTGSHKPRASGGYSAPVPSGYGDPNGEGQFADLDDDDGELPF